MKLKWLEFENTKTGLKAQRIYFNNDYSLLVGLSGVGKTQVLNAIEFSFHLAKGETRKLRPYKVSMMILINDDEYEWSYEINYTKGDVIIMPEERLVFFEESLKKNKEEIFGRTLNETRFVNFSKVPKTKVDDSLMVQYSEEEVLKPFLESLENLYLIETDMQIHGGLRQEIFLNARHQIDEIFKQNPDTDFSEFCHLPIFLKLYIVKKYYSDIYTEIFESVKELFIEINDIDVLEYTELEMYIMSIEVYGERILQHEISNGMLKTIFYIIELVTMPHGSLVLIDEFENGLGVNCIDVLVEKLLYHREDLQFIITSHHPKIIGGISSNKWIIIDRSQKLITNKTDNEYGIKNSLHDTYFNLINRWEYEGKI